jgi:hypothetical protein
MKVGTIVCPETSIRNYHYSLRDNPEEKSSHHVWVFFKGKEFVTIFVKSGQIIRQLKHKRKYERELKCPHFMPFSIKISYKMFVFQDTSCSHEVTGRECGQVQRRGAGPIPTTDVSRWCVFIDKSNILHSQRAICLHNQ